MLYQATAPKSIAADTSSVYFLDDGDTTVNKVDKKTKASAKLATTTQLSEPPDVTLSAMRLALSSDAVYWTGNNTNICSNRVFTVKKTGDGAAKIWYDDCLSRPTSGIVVDGLSVFVASMGTEGGVLKFSGGTSAVIAKGSSPWMLVTDATRVYASRTSDGVVFRVSKAGGDPEIVAMNQGVVSAMAADEQFVYWTSDSGRVLKLDKEALGEPVSLAQDEPGPTGLALDDACVYFTDANDPSGKIRMVPKAGGEVVTLAEKQRLPVSIAVDDYGIYWTNNASGEVMMMQRQ
ncbi:Putative serine/threonine-protein kinase pknH [Minicystis rosea]|nr:Putative serine/threonine-protein kinase pknH [Minicystis rosea]